MKTKWLLAFALAGLSIASAKTYSIKIYEPVVVEGARLKPGNYQLSLEQSKAVFLNDSRKTAAEVQVKVKNLRTKFEDTAVDTKSVNGKTQIESISLGGTRMRLEFH